MAERSNALVLKTRVSQGTVSSNLTPSAMSFYIAIVGRGTARAEALGYRTVNIPLDDTSVSGIYAATVKIGEEEYEAVAYADQKRKVLEAHILDFSKDLYGWSVTIALLKKIRDDKRFADDKSLRSAIAGDVAATRAYFKE